MDITKYSITQEELDDYVKTLNVPLPIIEIVDNAVVMNGNILYSFVDIDCVDIEGDIRFQHQSRIDRMCEEHFKDRLILPINQNALATKGDVEELNEMIMENLINTEYLTSLTELGL